MNPYYEFTTVEEDDGTISLYLTWHWGKYGQPFGEVQGTHAHDAGTLATVIVEALNANENLTTP